MYILLWSSPAGQPHPRAFDLELFYNWQIKRILPAQERTGCWVAAMTPLPDLVRLSKLDTQFYSHPEYTQHIKYISDSIREQRRVRKEEKWKKERGLGRGGAGVIWLERCIQGDSQGKQRAIKKVQKLEGGDCHRELEAIALFSHTKVGSLLPPLYPCSSSHLAPTFI